MFSKMSIAINREVVLIEGKMGSFENFSRWLKMVIFLNIKNPYYCILQEIYNKEKMLH